MKTSIKALFTLSDGKGTVYISKDKFYDLFTEGKRKYIVDNTGEEMDLDYETLNRRFEILPAV